MTSVLRVVRRLPGVWLFSGYARRDLDADRLCADCYMKWSDGEWFPRWCLRCRRRCR